MSILGMSSRKPSIRTGDRSLQLGHNRRSNFLRHQETTSLRNSLWYSVSWRSDTRTFMPFAVPSKPSYSVDKDGRRSKFGWQLVDRCSDAYKLDEHYQPPYWRCRISVWLPEFASYCALRPATLPRPSDPWLQRRLCINFIGVVASQQLWWSRLNQTYNSVWLKHSQQRYKTEKQHTSRDEQSTSLHSILL